ncbi:winged helix-turn-helix domain-containing protein [Paraburkholderia sp. GAS41]|jgi:molybdate transport system regulatory protein|uniref:winged helix-turn-helix domain-containing protein n=1 Tax=Paraburkholderia sp. GAS41 TaxID=3035134 RepID=UPI003D23BDD5
MLSRMAESAKTQSIPAKKIAAKAGLQPGTQASTPPSTSSRSKARPEVRFRMRIRKGDTVALGPGKVELLEAVREHGSISAAARSLDMSYRRAWLLIDELNKSLKSPATLSEQGGQSGGGCVLTPVGETIVRLYREVEAQAEAACAKQIDELIRLIKA